MGFWSRVWDTGASVMASVAEGAKRAVAAAKDVAGRAIGWMAEKAEHFVGNVKKAWKVVRPFVEQFQVGLRIAAKATAAYPWLSGALTALDKGVSILTAFENSPIAAKIDQAIKFAINLAKRWHAARQESLTPEELEEARRHRDTFRSAERESASEGERHQLQLVAAVNDFEIAKAELSRALEGEPGSFDHYLRLRATQKLLGMSESRFRSARTMQDLSVDDLFLVRIAADLAQDQPQLNAEAAARLDRILGEKHGKKLITFVYEELIAAWNLESVSMKPQLEDARLRVAKDTVLLRRLRADQKIQNELSQEDATLLAGLEVEVPKQEKVVAELTTRQRDVERYAAAAEGFLQLIEKTPEQLAREEREYVLDQGQEVGRIIIEAAEKKIAFGELSGDDQALIIDFANIFKEESGERMKVLEVTA